MAYLQHYRKRYIEWVRETIGDKEKLLFGTDELLSYVEKWISSCLTTTDVVVCNSRYRISCVPRINTGVYQLKVSDGVANAVYVIDEPAGLILFDPDDPENTATAPVDGTTIEVTFYRVNTNKLISELFFILSSNHTKLTASQKIMGVEMDLKELATAFYDQSVRWAAQGDC